MPTLSTNLRTQLAAAQTKTAWSNLLKSLLGSNIRIRCFRSSNANSTDPAADGTEFLNVGTDGNFQFQGGEIISLGTLSNVTVKTAAVLSTGKSVLRIEGNGYSITFSLGLAGSGSEYILGANPTGAASQGFAFSKTASLKPPQFLPSGVGPAAPAEHPKDYVAFRVLNYTDPNNVVAWGTGYFSQRKPDFTFDRPYMANHFGDIRQMRTPDGGGVVIGTGGDAFILGGDVMIMSGANNSQNSLPVQYAEIRAMPYGRWAGYPFIRGFDSAYDTLALPPHKIEIICRDGTIGEIIELYSARDTNNTKGSGRHINAPDQNQNFWEVDANNVATGRGIKPWFTSRMVHTVESHVPKMHPSAWHFMPGVESDAMDPRNVVTFASVTECWPVITGKNQFNGLNNIRVSPKWSRGSKSGFDTTIIDTFQQQPGRDDFITQAIGWGFEPASVGNSTWYMAPGGARGDRAGWPTQVVSFMSDPDGIRIHGAVPRKEIFRHWMLNYSNHSCHLFTNVERGTSISKPQILGRDVCYQGSYYAGGNQNYRPDIPNNGVELFSAVNGNHDGSFDKYGRRWTNEWARDLMHNQGNAACGAYLYGSPRHALLAAHSFRANVLCTWDLNRDFPKGMFLQREHNWYNWNFVNMWMCASPDENSFTSEELEAMWQSHLEAVYDSVYPDYSTKSTVFGQLLADMGMNIQVYTDGANTVYQPYDSKAFYFGQTLLLMKQSGAWDVMRARSVKCAATLDMIVDCLTKSAAGVFVDANGRGVDEFEQTRWRNPTATPVTFTNWGQAWPPLGQTDWITGRDGVIGELGVYGATGDVVNTKHFRAQTLKILKMYEFSNSTRVDSAITIVNGFYNTVMTTSPSDQLLFKNRYSMMGFIKQPDYVGAPT